MTKYICPRFDAGVGLYLISALNASREALRARCTSRYTGFRLPLLSCTVRWSVSLRCRNVSPDFHSSVSSPENIHGASPCPCPAVMLRSRESAPMRSASAASGVLIADGLMTSGSSAVEQVVLQAAASEREQRRTDRGRSQHPAYALHSIGRSHDGYPGLG